MPEHCPTCGAAVRVDGSDEGTMHYEQATQEPEWEYRAAVADDGGTYHGGWTDREDVEVELPEMLNSEPPYHEGWIERRTKAGKPERL